MATSEIAGPPGPPVRRPVSRLHAVAVFAAALAVYGNTLGFGFVWDDAHHVLENVAIRELTNIPRMFTTDVWSGGTRDVAAAPYYRPLFQVSLALDRAIWGERPFGYHLTNVLLHALASLLVWAVARRVLPTSVGALAAGLFFAVHPVHSEAVAWISARNEALCAILALESFRRHLRFVELGRPRDRTLSLAALFLSLLAKEMSVALPAIVFVHELSMGGGARRALRRSGPFIVVVFGYLGLRALVLEVLDWGGAALAHRVLTSFGILWEYLRLLAVPVGLKVFHDVPVQTRLLDGEVVAPLLALATIAAAMAVAWRRERRVFFGLAWTGLALLLVSGVPAELAPALMAERYLYFPSAGFALTAGALATAAGLGRAPDPSTGGATTRSRWVLSTGAVILAAMALATGLQNGVWRDNETFARAWVRDAPRVSAGHVQLAGAHAAAGRLADAEREYLEAIRLQPRSIEAHVNLANLYDEIGRTGPAEAHYRVAYALAPGHPEVLYNLAVHLLRQERAAEAEPLLRNVVELNPSSCDAHYNLGLIYLARGDRGPAIGHLEQAARIDPSDERYRVALTEALAGTPRP